MFPVSYRIRGLCGRPPALHGRALVRSMQGNQLTISILGKEHVMAGVDTSTDRPAPKRVWQTPRLQELGNVRQFVQTGGAHGKSGTHRDGPSGGGSEAKRD